MARHERKLPKGWAYLLSKRRVKPLLLDWDSEEYCVWPDGISISEQQSKWLMQLGGSTSYCFGKAVLYRDGGERKLYLYLYGLREGTIGNEGEQILSHNLAQFKMWLESMKPLLPTAPKEKVVFRLGFERDSTSHKLSLEEA